ncbi:MAG: aminodeoxychorismate synthase component I [Actinomycetota bacterium]
MIDARFDDLTPGSERSFRMIRPVGVVEACRPDEVADALDSLQGATSRGLWAAGFVGYEAAPGLDGDLRVKPRPCSGKPFADLPLLWFGLFEGCEDRAPLAADGEAPPVSAESPWHPSVDRTRYDVAIERIRDRIAAGDVYQVNHTLRLRTPIQGGERDLYRDLCLAQRGAYGAYLNTGRHLVLSASPELFFRIDQDQITARPMKGTAPRGRWDEEDQLIARRLLASEKERAENAMIVDLLRNDLGRIAEPGSVRVAGMFQPERYETVWQLTSTIAARLRPGLRLSDVFRALFPSGSVTGAPKVASMGLISELEDSPRGVYTGSIGYLAPEGSGGPRANFSVAIRTVVLDAETGQAEYGVGGGITHDSSAACEFDELLAKSLILTVRRPTFELLETLLYDPDNGYTDLLEHLERIAASARFFGFRYDEQSVETALEKAAVGIEDPTRVRITLARDGTLSLTTGRLPPAAEGQVRVALDPDPVDPADVWLYHKTTRRGPYDRRRAARPDVDDVLLTNTRGEVTESTIANLAVRLDGEWVTPALDCGLLPGTRRAALLRAGRLLERRITLDELRAAEDLALVSSVRGWRPAVVV